jgi:hypothetical protein
MTTPAANLIKEKLKEIEQKSNENHSTVTVRLSPKYGIMIKALSKALNFPISSSLTDITSKNIFNYLNDLDNDSLKEFEGLLQCNPDTYSANKLIETGRIEKPEYTLSFARKSEPENEPK